ncbi:hypothetical protein DUNSADRAFT_13387 [Dunaliella salina]|uniref:Uncharacterized protein n=1 Tax=Dunaliella salina TaxID=3046 RepID=A0ABQ7G9H8_DUNSA|nr:hypothetical protein DUNSADRAFT_13387 [Dunaliella salina]|eukprot:KAF5831236.1 hypothetical protein DUNSADRAFT_13387 [Dunaliella salina]
MFAQLWALEGSQHSLHQLQVGCHDQVPQQQQEAPQRQQQQQQRRQRRREQERETMGTPVVNASAAIGTGRKRREGPEPSAEVTDAVIRARQLAHRLLGQDKDSGAEEGPTGMDHSTGGGQPLSALTSRQPSSALTSGQPSSALPSRHGSVAKEEAAEQVAEEEGGAVDCHSTPLWSFFMQAQGQVPVQQPLVVLATCRLPAIALPAEVRSFFAGGLISQGPPSSQALSASREREAAAAAAATAAAAQPQHPHPPSPQLGIPFAAESNMTALQPSAPAPSPAPAPDSPKHKAATRLMLSAPDFLKHDAARRLMLPEADLGDTGAPEPCERVVGPSDAAPQQVPAANAAEEEELRFGQSLVDAMQVCWAAQQAKSVS